MQPPAGRAACGEICLPLCRLLRRFSGLSRIHSLVPLSIPSRRAKAVRGRDHATDATASRLAALTVGGQCERWGFFGARRVLRPCPAYQFRRTMMAKRPAGRVVCGTSAHNNGPAARGRSFAKFGGQSDTEPAWGSSGIRPTRWRALAIPRSPGRGQWPLTGCATPGTLPLESRAAAAVGESPHRWLKGGPS